MILLKPILESLTFNDLLKQSTPKRIKRANRDVSGPSMVVNFEKGNKYGKFKFRSNPSTTSETYQGHITFLEHEREKKRKGEGNMKCTVDCPCPDFRYRFAYVDNKKGAAPIGNKSLNKCINRPPHIMNPKQRIGLCKHLIHLKEYLIKRLQENTNGTLMERLDNIGQTLKDTTI